MLLCTQCSLVSTPDLCNSLVRVPGNLFPMTVRELQLFRALSSLLVDNRSSVPLSSIGVILIRFHQPAAGWARPGWAGHCAIRILVNCTQQTHLFFDRNLFLIEESPITFTFSTCLLSLCHDGGQRWGPLRWRLLLLTGGCYLTMAVVEVVVVRSGGCRRC